MQPRQPSISSSSTFTSLFSTTFQPRHFDRRNLLFCLYSAIVLHSSPQPGSPTHLAPCAGWECALIHEHHAVVVLDLGNPRLQPWGSASPHSQFIPSSKTTDSIALALASIFNLPFSAQKTYVKPQNHLTHSRPTTSAWHFS